MIGNEYLSWMYNNKDTNYVICEMLEDCRTGDSDFIKSLFEQPVDLSYGIDDEIHFLTIICTIIDWKSKVLKYPLPKWINDKRLYFKYPYYYNEGRLTDFDKVKLLITNPIQMCNRNVYFDMSGLERV